MEYFAQLAGLRDGHGAALVLIHVGSGAVLLPPQRGQEGQLAGQEAAGVPVSQNQHLGRGITWWWWSPNRAHPFL